MRQIILLIKSAKIIIKIIKYISLRFNSWGNSLVESICLKKENKYRLLLTIIITLVLASVMKNCKIE